MDSTAVTAVETETIDGISYTVIEGVPSVVEVVTQPEVPTSLIEMLISADFLGFVSRFLDTLLQVTKAAIYAIFIP